MAKIRLTPPRLARSFLLWRFSANAPRIRKNWPRLAGKRLASIDKSDMTAYQRQRQRIDAFDAALTTVELALAVMDRKPVVSAAIRAWASVIPALVQPLRRREPAQCNSSLERASPRLVDPFLEIRFTLAHHAALPARVTCWPFAPIRRPISAVMRTTITRIGAIPDQWMMIVPPFIAAPSRLSPPPTYGRERVRCGGLRERGASAPSGDGIHCRAHGRRLSCAITFQLAEFSRDSCVRFFKRCLAFSLHGHSKPTARLRQKFCQNIRPIKGKDAHKPDKRRRRDAGHPVFDCAGTCAEIGRDTISSLDWMKPAEQPTPNLRIDVP